MPFRLSTFKIYYTVKTVYFIVKTNPCKHVLSLSWNCKKSCVVQNVMWHWLENLSQDSSQMGTPSWWVTLAFARWGCRKTPARWLPPCSRPSGTATLRTHGSWRTWAPMVRAGAASRVITPHWTYTARGRTSPRVNWGPSPSGAAWNSTEEEGLWWIWGQIYKIPAGIKKHEGPAEMNSVEWQMMSETFLGCCYWSVRNYSFS